jgi:hypothetical protein
MTLIELVVTVAILTIAGGCGYAALAQRPAQARSTAVAFAGLVTEARALAAITGDPTLGGGSGASIGVVRDGDAYVATLYAYRPIAGARGAAVTSAASLPLRTTTELALDAGTGLVEPPFAVFFSASGHASAQAPFRLGVDPPLAAEPACPSRTGILVAFLDGVAGAAYPISCEMARLDLDAPVPIAR